MASDDCVHLRASLRKLAEYLHHPAEMTKASLPLALFGRAGMAVDFAMILGTRTAVYGMSIEVSTQQTNDFATTLPR
jgi:hypothetical protein